MPQALTVCSMAVSAMRDEIDVIDRKIIRLIAKRQEIAGKMGRAKLDAGIPIHDEERARKVLAAAFNYAVEEQIDPVSIRKIFEILIEMSEERQSECTGDGNLP
jgi:chorismate mutase